MTITSPSFQSQLSIPTQANNFTPLQAVRLSATATTSSKTFTIVPGTNRVTIKICNTGTKTAFVATGRSSATAVVSSGTPTPAVGTPAVANCDCVPAGSILTQDYAGGTDTIAAICDGSDSTTLEVSIGFGQ